MCVVKIYPRARLGVGDVVDLLADSPHPASPHHVEIVRPVELLIADPQLDYNDSYVQYSEYRRMTMKHP